MSLDDFKNDPEVAALMEKARNQFGGMLDEFLSLAYQKSVGANAAKAPSRVTSKSSAALIKSYLAPDDSVLQSSQDLVNQVTVNFHSKIPKSAKIGNSNYEFDRQYTEQEVADALGLQRSSISAFASMGYIYKEPGKNLYSGYEIIRRAQRPNGKSPTLVMDLAQKLFTAPDTIYKLAGTNAIDENSDKLPPKFATSLYKLVFPMKGTERYHEVMALLKSAQNFQQPPNTDPQNHFSDPVRYISESNVHFTPNKDYKPVPDSLQRPKDAYEIRHYILSEKKRHGKHKGAKDIVMLHRDDVNRLKLANVFIPEIEIEKESILKLGAYDKPSIIGSLSLAELAPEIYRGELRFPVGTVELAGMPDAEIKKIAELARPVVSKHGQFIPMSTIEDWLNLYFNLTTFQKAQQAGKIPNIMIDGQKLHMAFYVAREYESILRSKPKMPG